MPILVVLHLDMFIFTYKFGIYSFQYRADATMRTSPSACLSRKKSILTWNVKAGIAMGIFSRVIVWLRTSYSLFCNKILFILLYILQFNRTYGLNGTLSGEIADLEKCLKDAALEFLLTRRAQILAAIKFDMLNVHLRVILFDNVKIHRHIELLNCFAQTEARTQTCLAALLVAAAAQNGQQRRHKTRTAKIPDLNYNRTSL